MYFEVGDPVTVLPPYDGDPIIVSIRTSAEIADVVQVNGERHYLIKFDAVWPPNQRFGPFPVTRLVPGWQWANEMRRL